MMRIFNYLPLISKPTRFPVACHQQSSLLDHSWLNSSLNYGSSAGILLDDVTDHCPIFLTLPKSILMCNGQDDSKFRLVNSDTLIRFHDMIPYFDWSVVGDMSVNDAATFFVNSVNDAYCRSFSSENKKRLLRRQRVSHGSLLIF